jgi:hypothetical protein
MITKHCVRWSLSLCPKQAKGVTGVQGTIRAKPLTMVSGGDTLILRFDCKPCEMHVVGRIKRHVLGDTPAQPITFYRADKAERGRESVPAHGRTPREVAGHQARPGAPRNDSGTVRTRSTGAQLRGRTGLSHRRLRRRQCRRDTLQHCRTDDHLAADVAHSIDKPLGSAFCTASAARLSLPSIT